MLASQVSDNEILRRRLPPPAFEKLLSLISREDQITAAFGQIFDLQQPLHRRLQIAEEKFRQLEGAPLHSPMFVRQKDGGFSYTPPAEREAELRRDRDKIVAAARTERDAARDELARLDQRGSDLKRRLSPVATRAIGWLRGLPDHVKITMHNGPVAKPPAGDDLAKAVEALRAQLAKIDGNIAAAKAAPLPPSDAKAIAKKIIDEMAEKAAPDLRRVVEHGFPPFFATTNIQPHGQVPFPTVDALGFLFWLNKDFIAERFAAEIDRLVDPNIEALSTRQRERRIAELRAERLSVERQEESAIELAEQQRIEIRRRDEAHAVAVLNLADDLVALTT